MAGVYEEQTDLSESEKYFWVWVPRIESVSLHCQHSKSAVMDNKCDKSINDESQDFL